MGRSWKKDTITFVKKFRTNSVKETQKVGERIGKRLKAGDVVALEGPLGAGKTTLVKGIAKGLGVKDKKAVVSPTFVLIHEYEARERIYHMDWYRLSKVEGQDRLQAEEYFNSKGITLVEWADRGKAIFPKSHIRILLKYDGPERRIIEVHGMKNETISLRHLKRGLERRDL